MLTKLDFDWAAALMLHKYGEHGGPRALRQGDALHASGQLPASLLWYRIAALIAGAPIALQTT